MHYADGGGRGTNGNFRGANSCSGRIKQAWEFMNEEQNKESYREKGLDDICFDGTQGLVLDDHKDLLLLLQVDKVTEPRFFGKSVTK